MMIRTGVSIAVAIAVSQTILVAASSAAVIITMSEVGNDLVGSVVGEANINDLTSNGGGGDNAAFISDDNHPTFGPSFSFRVGDAPPFLSFADDWYTHYNLGPSAGPTAPLGSGMLAKLSADTQFAADPTRGGAGIYQDTLGNIVLDLPNGYSSGPLSGTATWLNKGLSDIGFSDGDTFTWNWGTGVNADSLTLTFSTTAIPEPSSLLLFGIVAAATLRLKRQNVLRGS